LGLTALVIEDSRFACEAMRLLCLRSGARIRRLTVYARRGGHLQVYRPSIVIADLGLPRRNGIDLIAETGPPRSPALMPCWPFRATPIWQRMRWPLGRTVHEQTVAIAVAVSTKSLLAALPPHHRPTGPRCAER